MLSERSLQQERTDAAHVLEFDHLIGACAITGGYVYRGADDPRARGAATSTPTFAPVSSAPSASSANQAVEKVDWNVPSVGQVLSFGEDASGELYVITASAKIYRIAKM